MCKIENQTKKIQEHGDSSLTVIKTAAMFSGIHCKRSMDDQTAVFTDGLIVIDLWQEYGCCS